uniref:GNAT family N-acetyltransferase n=1 Tax=Thaumasiovibrio occultus TaxID=1891184 RepID=UPI000B34CAD9|nr:N-acetyltransferase [Thaumasiovibrio occultus]
MDYTFQQLTQSDELSQLPALFAATFTDSEGEAEGEMLRALSSDLLSTTGAEELRIFVAKHADQLVGCVLFSALNFEPASTRAMLLSPMAISTAHQGKGAGQGLIRFGLAQLRSESVELVLTYGDPQFYSRVGFAQITEEQAAAPQPLSYPHGWLGLTLNGGAFPHVEGPSRCVAALDKPDFW